MQPKQKSPFQGLVNEGSTCYLNSLLQTLFMTGQFRKNIYSYLHNSKKLQQKNSIPYQLQKLFVLLQTSSTPVYTKSLLKSFQWSEADSFQQHDVQQFCRILFQAIQISNKKAHFISDLFSGQTISFVDCGIHSSEKNEIFMDLSLPIHNPYTKKQFQTLQQCIKEYLKVQKLQDKFFCQSCNQKVHVEKGLKINKLPKILTIQLNRFELNYQTWMREKINTFLYFPEILYMDKFIKKYQDIEINKLPKDLKDKVKLVEKEKSARTVNYFNDTNNKIQRSRKKSDQIQNHKEKVFFYDQENKREKQQKMLTKQQQKQKNRQILANLKSQKIQKDNKVKKPQSKQQKEPSAITKQLQDDMLFGSGMGFLSTTEPINWKSGQFSTQTSNKPNYSNTNTQFHHQQQSYCPQKVYPPNTYILYSILVHSGGAYGGHYYAYISDSNGQWYRFDDSSVHKCSKYEIRKYGGFDKSQHGANAYLLFYRNVQTMKQANINSIEIPEQLMEKVKMDLKNNVNINVGGNDEEEKNKEKRINQINNGVMVKVLNININNNINSNININVSNNNNSTNQSSQFQSLFIQNRHQQTIHSLKLRLLSTLPQLQNMDQQNWRLRRYNKLQQTLHQIYDYSYNQTTLQTLGFRQTVYLAIQTKQSNDEIFQQYDPRQIVIKVNLWRENITVITEKILKPMRVQISQQAKFRQLIEKIKKKTKIQHLVVMKRNFSQSNPITVYGQSQNNNKKLIQLRFFNGINLYVQQNPSFTINNSKWLSQFQSQRFRCLIKHNNPLISQSSPTQQLYFDTRKTLKQLKQHFSLIYSLPISQFRIKKTKQSVSQLTNYNKKLIDLKFINTEYVYLEQGKSSYGAVILKKGKVQIIQDKIQFNVFEEVIVEINQNIITVKDLIEKLSELIKINKENLRIRQFKAYQFGQIFSHNDSISRIKQKSLIYQQITQQQSSMKGIQLYLRIFDITTMQLSQLKQIYIDHDSTYQQLAYIIQQQTSIKFNKILLWKALSNYVQKSILLDCQWYEISYIKAKIKEQPLYLNIDGEIIILKQADKEYHPKVNYTVNNILGGKDKNNKEANLKITVMNDYQYEQEEEQQLQKQLKLIQQMELIQKNNKKQQNQSI